MLYAWQLVLTYRTNKFMLKRNEALLSLLTILVGFGTTCAGLAAHAGALFAKDAQGELACGVLSTAMGFLLAAQRYFEFGSKAAACELAESQVSSLVYRYRTRTGDFAHGGSGNQLEESLAAFKDQRTAKRRQDALFAKFEKGAKADRGTSEVAPARRRGPRSTLLI